MLNLDTHILIFALTDGLKPRERQLLLKNQWSISGIVLWELHKLQQLGRLKLDPHEAEYQRILSGLHVWPIDIQVYRALDQLDFKNDPADEIIAATSLANKIPLLTRDEKIRASKVITFA